MGGCNDICSVILAILLPPLGVLCKFGCTSQFVIAIILTLLGYVPGIIYALYLIVTAEPEECKQPGGG